MSPVFLPLMHRHSFLFSATGTDIGKVHGGRLHATHYNLWGSGDITVHVVTTQGYERYMSALRHGCSVYTTR